MKILNSQFLSLLFLNLLICAPVSAAQIADIEFPNSIQIDNTNHILQLNGLAIRSRFFFKIYAAALYIEQPSHNAEDILQHTGTKRMHMHFIYDEVPREKLVNGWIDGFEKNLSQDDFNILKPRIDQFNALFDTVHEGDIIYLDYLPLQGTRVTIKGVEKGIIKGIDFNQALLKIWIGEEPVSDDMKQGLLGIDD